MKELIDYINKGHYTIHIPHSVNPHLQNDAGIKVMGMSGNVTKGKNYVGTYYILSAIRRTC